MSVLLTHIAIYSCHQQALNTWPVLPVLLLIISPVWIFIFLCHTAYNIHFSRRHLLSFSHAHSTMLGNTVGIQRMGPIATHPVLGVWGRRHQPVVLTPMQVVLGEGCAGGCGNREGRRHSGPWSSWCIYEEWETGLVSGPGVLCDLILPKFNSIPLLGPVWQLSKRDSLIAFQWVGATNICLTVLWSKDSPKLHVISLNSHDYLQVKCCYAHCRGEKNWNWASK